MSRGKFSTEAHVADPNHATDNRPEEVGGYNLGVKAIRATFVIWDAKDAFGTDADEDRT
jgi:hypothetical protein